MNAINFSGLEVGSTVGAKRWPCSHAHPGCWGQPWAGELLAVNDPRAWRGSLAFGFSDTLPSQADVDRHVAWCLGSLGPDALQGSVPVLWDFNGEQVAMWESAASVRPYEADVAEWRMALAEEYARRGDRPALRVVA